ncbi:MAG: LD-carboxypeptidase [Bacteroidaceae bacterium]|nr:LD-carboxypeptidase [Bacteroidaceae bacterium]
MQKPHSLKYGDTVAVISPAGALRDISIVEGACNTLHQWGLQTVVASNTYSRNGYYAGTAQERGDNFVSLIKDDKIKAILCSYGGYGCVHIVDAVAAAIADNPKWIMGMSDCSVLHAACINRGVMSLHSSQCRQLHNSPCSESVQFMRDILFGGNMSYTVDANRLNICGTARGRIVGGNLSVLHALMRTPYDIFTPGVILFIEDINEPVYRIERMLYSLKLSGVLQNLSALIVGQFTGVKEHTGFGSTLNEIIRSLVADCNIPVCFDFPVGHCDRNYPIIEGADVTLTISENEVIFKEVI